MTKTITAQAPGKINPLLRVGPVNDTGYHEIFTLFHALDLWETVSATEADEFSLTLEGDVPLENVPLDGSNLVLKAAHALAAVLGHTGGAALHIHKRIPVGGGMGGGSADAAAALVALNELWGSQADADTLREIAQGLGADVPFALQGGSALGRGNGSELEPLAAGPLYWVLIPVDHHLSTAEVYAHFDVLGGSKGEELPTELPQDMMDALVAGDGENFSDFLENDLAGAAADLYPGLITGLLDSDLAGSLHTMVSGSGPTCVALARDVEHQSDIVQSLWDNGHHPIPTVSTPLGAHLV